jgi:hypothetical protein
MMLGGAVVKDDLDFDTTHVIREKRYLYASQMGCETTKCRISFLQKSEDKAGIYWAE